MPYDDPEPDDPHVLVGVSFEGSEEATREMAAAFADEFAQLGYDRDRILEMFRAPFYAGPHSAYSSLGEAQIRSVIDQSVAFWGRFRVRVQEAPSSDLDEARGSGVNATWKAARPMSVPSAPRAKT